MPFDYSGSHALIADASTGTYTPPGSSPISGVVMRKGSVTHSDYQTYRAPVDASFNVWLGTITGATIAINGVLTFASVAWVIVAIPFIAGDGSQARCLCRKAI